MHRTSFAFFVKLIGLRGREEAELKRRDGGRKKGTQCDHSVNILIFFFNYYLSFSALLRASCCCCVVAIGLGEVLFFVLSSATVP